MERLSSISKEVTGRSGPLSRQGLQGDSVEPTRRQTPEQGTQRDYKAEREAARLRTTDRVADLAVARRDQT